MVLLQLLSCFLPSLWLAAMLAAAPGAVPGAVAAGGLAFQPDEQHEHDHAEHEHGGAVAEAGPTMAQRIKRLVRWLGGFHPPAVNFPIALLVAAAVAEVLLMATGRPLYEQAGLFCVRFGALAAVAAGLLGWFFAGFRLTDGDWLLTTHRWVGTSTAAWSLLLLWLSGGARSRVLYRLALFPGALLVLTAGFFGGAMIYGLEHYAW